MLYGSVLPGAAVSLAPSAQEAREAFTGLTRREMAVTANPLATDAAVLALKLGGSAADAAVTGSPGGARIIGHMAQSLVNLFDFGLDPRRAVDIPHFMNQNAATELELPVPPSAGGARRNPRE